MENSSHDTPEDFVIATGVTTTIRDFVKMAFGELGIELEFKGEGVEEVGSVVKCTNPEYQLEIGKEIIAVDPRYFRPTEVELLIGDPAKMKEKLGWTPKYDLPALVKDMIWSDVKLFNRDKYLKKGGHKVLNYHE